MNFKVAILQKRAENAKQNENVDVILKSMQEAAENKALADYDFTCGK